MILPCTIIGTWMRLRSGWSALGSRKAKRLPFTRGIGQHSVNLGRQQACGVEQGVQLFRGRSATWGPLVAFMT
jgi:hypothetical protein